MAFVGRGALLVFACAAFAFVWAGGRAIVAQDVSERPHAVLDVDMGEFLAETLGRSSYVLPDLLLPSDGYAHILLTPFENNRPRTPELVLRTQSGPLTLPYLPARGDLYVEAGLVQELRLSFYNFEALRLDAGIDMREGFDSAILGPPEDDIAPIIALHESLQAMGWPADSAAFCAPQAANPVRHRLCLDKMAALSNPPTPAQLNVALIDYTAKLRAAWAADGWDALDALGPLVIGQWALPDGRRMTASVWHRFDMLSPERGGPPAPRDFNLRLDLELSAFLGVSDRLVRACHAAQKAPQDVLAERRAYTPEQARIIYGGLLVALVPADADPQRHKTPSGAWDGVSLRAIDEAVTGIPRPAQDKAGEAACQLLPSLQDLAGVRN